MNAAQIHLALNHVPLLLSITGGAILIWGMIKKSDPIKTLSMYLMVAAALFTAPVFLTGEGTEELVEKMAGVTETAIEQHEAMAKISLIVIIVTGCVALVSLLVKKNATLAKLFFTGALFLSLASFGTMAKTAHLGGLIRHNELQNGVTAGVGGNQDDKEENENDEMRSDNAPKDSLNKTRENIKKDDD